MAVAFDPLIIEPVDRLALEGEIAAALNDPASRIFLDTNVLMWTYGLHQGARTDLCDWLQSGPQAGRIHVPRRVIHEFSAHRDASEKLYPFGQEFKPLGKLMERFEQMAPLVADDAWALANGFVDRASYLRLVADAHAELRRLVGPVTRGEKLEKLHQQLLPVFNALALEGDIFLDMVGLHAAYEARAELRVPPGYKDMRKGKGSEAANLAAGAPATSGANRFGDLAIWDEILTFVAIEAPDTTSVVIITHDTKPDWSYIPGRIVDSDGHAKPNPQSGPAQLTVAQPMLVHELRKRTSAVALYIVTVPQLAVVANGHEVGFRFTELARAVQVGADAETVTDEQLAVVDDAPDSDDGDEGGAAPAEGNAGPEVAPEAAPVVVIEPVGGEALAAFLAAPPVEALADRAYVADREGPAEFGAAIQGLRSNNWYLQNPAIRDGMALLSEGQATLLQAFIFGRNIYQAAVGTAADAMRLLEDFSSRGAHCPPPLIAAVYAGALFELYFDGEGALRLVPKDGQIGPLLRHQRTATLAPAIGFIRQRLMDAHLLVRPSLDAPTVRLTVSFEGDNVIAVMFGDVPLTEPHDEADFGASPLPASASWRRLRSLVADYFAAPEEQIDLDPTFEGTRLVADLQFIHWNPVDGPPFG